MPVIATKESSTQTIVNLMNLGRLHRVLSCWPNIQIT